jgi:hypothetical protein
MQLIGSLVDRQIAMEHQRAVAKDPEHDSLCKVSSEYTKGGAATITVTSSILDNPIIKRLLAEAA